METIQTEIKYVNPPKQAGWSGSVKGADGFYYSVPGECLGMFQVGHVYNITYENKVSKKGSPFKEVTAVNGQPMTTGHPPVAPQQPAPPAQQPATTGQPQHKDKDTFPSIEEQFIKEIVGGACRAGTIDPRDFDALSVAVNNARSVWKSYEDFNRPAPPVYDEMNPPPPEVPF